MNDVWQQFWIETKAVMQHGGIVLWCMLGLAVVLYSVLASTWLGLFQVKKEIGELDQSIENKNDVQGVIADVELFELDRLAWVERRLPMLLVMIAIAPLAGLLGTVVGMLNTFSGMASQSAAKPIDSISSGISQALVTTQAGLFMAIPAALLFVLLKSRLAQVHGKLEQYASQKVIQLKGGQS